MAIRLSKYHSNPRLIQLRLFVFCLAAGLACTASPAPAVPFGAVPGGQGAPPIAAPAVHKIAVFGKDNRRAPPRKYRKLRNSIGLLFNKSSATACTAFCVADNVIATASHCLFEINSKRPPQLSQLLFARRYESARDYTRIAGGRAGAAQNVMAGSTSLKVNPPIDATGDWAFIKLARPACAKRALTIRPMKSRKLMAMARQKRVFQLAYHRDYANWRLAYSRSCDIRRDFGATKWINIRRDFSRSDQLILHTCDTGGASSGSPIFADGPAGPQVVGINVGTYIQSSTLVQNGRVKHRYNMNVVANTAVSAGAFADSLAIFRRAVILATPRAVRQLQRELKRHSLYKARIDGAYGPLTREAIIGFETAHGLPITGIASEVLLARAKAAPSLPRRTHRTTAGFQRRAGAAN